MRRIHTGRGAAIALAATLLGGLVAPAAAFAAVPAPTGLAPDDSSVSSPALHKNLELSWTPVPGAVSYEVQISDDASFTDGALLTETTVIPHWVVPVQLPRGAYLWRVRADTPDGPGRWSQPASFTRGWDRAIAPANPHIVAWDGDKNVEFAQGDLIAMGPGALPTFTWHPIAGASFYELEISNRPFDTTYPPYGGTQDDYRFTCYTQRTWFSPYGVVSGPSDAPGDEGKCPAMMDGEPTPADGTIGKAFHGDVRYYWRVRGRDGTVDKRETPFAQPALSCAGVWESAGGIKVPPPDDAPEGTPPSFEYKIPSSPPKYLTDSECSQWGAGGSFTVLPRAWEDVEGTPAKLAARPTAGAPTAADVTLTGTPVLSWDAVPAALKYRVYLSRTPDFTDSDAVYETHATSLSPAHSFANRSAPTYWTVQACGAIGCGSAAEAKIFRKQSPNGVRTLGDPTVNAGETTFRWTTQSPALSSSLPRLPHDDQAMAYQLQVTDLAGDYSKPTLNVRVDHLGTDPTRTHWRVAKRSLPDQYIWRVRAIDETGRAWGWAYSKPYARILTKPGFSLGAPLAVEFTAPVDGVTAETVRVLDSKGNAVPATIDELSDRRYQVMPRGTWTAGEIYRLSVQDTVKDANGFSAAAVKDDVRASTVVDSASAALTKQDGTYPWRTVQASDARGGTYIRAKGGSGTTAWVETKVRGQVVVLRACKSPNSGYADVYVDGQRVKRVDLYRSYSGCRRVFYSAELADTVHTVTVVVTGHKRAASKGADVAVDAIRVY